MGDPNRPDGRQGREASLAARISLLTINHPDIAPEMNEYCFLWIVANPSLRI